MHTQPQTFRNFSRKDEIQQADILLSLLRNGRITLLNGILQLVHATPQTVLCLCLFTNQNHLSSGIVQRNIRNEQTVACQTIQTMQQWRSNEQNRIRFRTEFHATLDFETSWNSLLLARHGFAWQRKRRIRSFDNFLEAQCQRSRSLEIEIGGHQTPECRQWAFEQLTKTAAHLNQFQLVVDEEMPWKSFAECVRIHFEIGRCGNWCDFIFFLIVDGTGQSEQVAITLRIAFGWFDGDAHIDSVEHTHECLQRAEQQPSDDRTFGGENQFTRTGANEFCVGHDAILHFQHIVDTIESAQELLKVAAKALECTQGETMTAGGDQFFAQQDENFTCRWFWNKKFRRTIISEL